MKFLWMGLGLVGLLLVGSGLSGSHATLAAAPTLTPRVYLPLQLRQWSSLPRPTAPFGVSDSPSFAVVSSPVALNLFQTAGLAYDRTSVDWNRLEPQHTTPDQYNWGFLDERLNPLFAQGIEPFMLILNTPPWAANTNCGPLYDPNEIGELLSALAARYPTVTYWGLYNEVDGAVYSIYQSSSGGCFGEPDLDGNGKPDYADYAELMRIGWKALHTTNPNAQLVFGIFAFDNFTPASAPPDYPGGCCFNYQFLDKLLGYMKLNPLPQDDKYADVMGFNNYLAYDLGYWDRRYPSVGAGAKILALRAKMAQYGFDFPMIISEMSSWPTLPSAEGVPQAIQARQAAQMYAETAFYDIKAVMWWPWSDYPDTNCGVPVQCDLFKYGLVDANQTPKLSYFALKTLVQQLGGYTPTTSEISDTKVNFGFKKANTVKRVVFARTNTFRDATVTFRFEAKRIRVVSMLGGVATYDDNGAGRISLDVTADPVYVEINP